jgi:hypothetical protein
MSYVDDAVEEAGERLARLQDKALSAGDAEVAEWLGDVADQLRRARFHERENYVRWKEAETVLDDLGIQDWEPMDGDERCQSCGRPNPVWFTDNDVWNTVMPDDGILCPTCFMLKADDAMGQPIWSVGYRPAPLTITVEPGAITAELMGEDDD